MKPRRRSIPKEIQESVLREYRHKCAVCGEASPHLHHIDENPANNDALNLLPLCPNCHLLDQHNPTFGHCPGILGLFRRYKDPSILKPQFRAIYDRLKFLFELEDYHTQERLGREITDLLMFVSGMEMGTYYSGRLKGLLRVQPYTGIPHEEYVLPEWTEEKKAQKRVEFKRQQLEMEREWADDQRAVFELTRDEVLSLIVESLRFQRW